MFQNNDVFPKSRKATTRPTQGYFIGFTSVLGSLRSKRIRNVLWTRYQSFIINPTVLLPVKTASCTQRDFLGHLKTTRNTAQVYNVFQLNEHEMRFWRPSRDVLPRAQQESFMCELYGAINRRVFLLFEQKQGFSLGHSKVVCLLAMNLVFFEVP